MMMQRFSRPALLAFLAVVLVAVITFTFSPTARAAVLELLNFNGVTVTMDDETGKLVVSGNTDAVIEQTDNSVMIQGENGEIAGVAVVQNLGEPVDVSALLAENPDLVLPNVPSGYILEPQAMRLEDETLIINWKNDMENLITYIRSTIPPIPMILGNSREADGILPLEGITSTTSSAPLEFTGADTGQAVVVSEGTSVSGLAGPDGEIEIVSLPLYEWQADGYYHSLTASDTTMDVEALKGMLP